MYKRVKIKNGGQIIDLVSSVANAMIEGGTAEPWPPEKSAKIETCALAPLKHVRGLPWVKRFREMFA